MKKASIPAFILFAVYCLAAIPAHDAVLRVAAPVLNASIAALASALGIFMTSHAAPVAFGLIAALALVDIAASKLSPALRRKRARTRLYPAEFVFVAICFAFYFLYGAVFILLMPLLDNSWNAATGAVVAFAWLTDPSRDKQDSRVITPPKPIVVIAAALLWFAAGLAAAAVIGRPGPALFSAFLAMLCIRDGLAKSASRNARPVRRAFLILTIACAVGVHSYLTAAPAWCSRWKPSKDEAPVILKGDAFDVITINGRLFACFKDGSLMRASASAAPDAPLEKIDLGAPAQRMAYSRPLNRLYAVTYKSSTPVTIIDPDRFIIVGRISAPDCAATDVAVDESGTKIFFNCESDGRIYSADASTGAIISMRRFPHPTNICSLAVAGGSLYAVSASLDPYLYKLDAATLETKSRLRIGFANQGISLQPQRGSLFIARLMASAVDEIDTAAMRARHGYPAGLVVRDIQAIDKCTLLAADYAGPDARIIDTCTGETAHIWRLAPRVRGIWHDSATGDNYAACSCGVFKLLP